jgi:acetolactate synthase regulatory subunit
MKPIAAVLLLSGFSIALSAHATERKLVVGLSAQASNANERALERVLDNPSTRGVQVVSLGAASVAADTTQLELYLGGRQFKANRVKAERAASGNLVWSGSLEGVGKP